MHKICISQIACSNLADFLHPENFIFEIGAKTICICSMKIVVDFSVIFVEFKISLLNLRKCIVELKIFIFGSNDIFPLEPFQ